HLELCVLAGELLRAVVVREGHLDLDLVAGRAARDRLVELSQQVLRAELDREVLALRAVERLAVDRALVVDHDDVTGLRGAVDRVQAAEALAQALDLAVDGFVVDLNLLAPHLEARVPGDLRAGPDPAPEAELQLLALRRELVEVELGVADRVDAGLDDGALVPLGERVLESLLEHRLAAEPLDHELRGHLSLAETG